MQKTERELTEAEDIEGLLQRGKYASIALCRDDEPYIVTLSYGYDRQSRSLYFHTALKGLKNEILATNPRACATIIEDLGYIATQCTHAYRSAVLWGRMTLVEDLDEKKRGMEVLFHHLEDDPDPIRARNLQDDKAYDRVAIMKFEIEKMTGKAGN